MKKNFLRRIFNFLHLPEIQIQKLKDAQFRNFCKIQYMLLFESSVKVSVYLSPNMLIFSSFSLIFSLPLFLSSIKIFLFKSIVELAGVKIIKTHNKILITFEIYLKNKARIKDNKLIVLILFEKRYFKCIFSQI